METSLTSIQYSIENGNQEAIHNVQEILKADVLQRSLAVLGNLSSRRDALAESLLPDDLPPIKDGFKLFPVKTLGNGDCLYNAVSISLRDEIHVIIDTNLDVGDETLTDTLRALAATELFLNADKFTNHPHISTVIQHSECSLSSDSIHTIVLSDEGCKVYNQTASYKSAILAMANETCTKGSWSSFVHLLALSSALNRNIWSVYPMTNMGIRPLFHSLINAGDTLSDDAIYIMWTRDGNLDSRPGVLFQPNHFVPLIREIDTDFYLHALEDGEDDMYLSIDTITTTDRQENAYSPENSEDPTGTTASNVDTHKARQVDEQTEMDSQDSGDTTGTTASNVDTHKDIQVDEQTATGSQESSGDTTGTTTSNVDTHMARQVDEQNAMDSQDSGDTTGTTASNVDTHKAIQVDEQNATGSQESSGDTTGTTASNVDTHEARQVDEQTATGGQESSEDTTGTTASNVDTHKARQVDEQTATGSQESSGDTTGTTNSNVDTHNAIQVDEQTATGGQDSGDTTGTTASNVDTHKARQVDEQTATGGQESSGDTTGTTASNVDTQKARQKDEQTAMDSQYSGDTAGTTASNIDTHKARQVDEQTAMDSQDSGDTTGTTASNVDTHKAKQVDEQTAMDSQDSGDTTGTTASNVDTHKARLVDEQTEMDSQDSGDTTGTTASNVDTHKARQVDEHTATGGQESNEDTTGTTDSNVDIHTARQVDEQTAIDGQDSGGTTGTTTRDFYSQAVEHEMIELKSRNSANQTSDKQCSDAYSTDDNLPLSSFITKHKTSAADEMQTDTDDSLPLATLITKSKKISGVVTVNTKQKKKEVKLSTPDDIGSDSSLSDSDEYDSDINIEKVLDECGSSSSDSNDESDNEYETSDSYSALRWSDKLRGIKERPFEGPVPGPRRHLSNTCTPLDQFFEIFPESLFKMITESTEAYVPIYQAKKRQKDPIWKDTTYKPVTIEMIRAYLGIRMIMAVDPKSSLSDYWSTNPSLRNERIAKTMSRDRFVNIQRYFHINDPRQDPARLSGEDAEAKRKKDPLYKVSPLMERVRKRSKRLYNLHQQVSIDEAMIKCHGQHWGIVGAPNKPAKRGFKIFVLADAVSGYMTDFMVYLRRQKEVGLTQNVVETLAEPIVDRNHVIFIDKFYTSVPLALSLIEKGTFISGSFNQGRRYWPSDLKISKTKKRKEDKVRNLKRGESMERQTRDGKLLATVWKDKKHVYNLNTYYDTLYNRRESTVERKERNTEGKWRRTEFTCPKPIVEFNKYMGGVDRHDHLRSNYSLQRSCTRWWTYFAWFAIDLALINAFLLYKHVHPKAKHKKFHLKVAEQLIGGFSDRKRAPRQFDADDVFLGTTAHEQDVMPGRAKACRLCLQLGNRTPSGRPKETNHGCVDCKVNLHRDCFAAYHDTRKRKNLTLDAYTQTGEVFLTPTKGRPKRSIVGLENPDRSGSSKPPAKRSLMQGVKPSPSSNKRKSEQSAGNKIQRQDDEKDKNAKTPRRSSAKKTKK